MSRAAAVCVVIVVLLCPLVVLGQSSPNAPGTVTRDPQAVTLLAQCAATMGASLIQDTYAEGSMVSAKYPNATGAIISESKGLNVRNDIADASGSSTYVVNAGGASSTANGKTTKLPYQAGAYPRPDYVPALACAIDLARPYMSVSYMGVEQVNGRPAYHIQFNATLASDEDNSEKLISEFHVYLDQQTLLVVKTQSWAFAPDNFTNRSTWETYYDNYQNVNGVLMPFHVSQYLAGMKVQDITFTSVRVNVGVSDSQFN